MFVGNNILEQFLTTLSTIEDMDYVPCVSVVGSLMYAMVCTRLNIDKEMGFLTNFRREHWDIVKRPLCICEVLLNIPFSIIVMF
jgi:hypothetical protein